MQRGRRTVLRSGVGRRRHHWLQEQGPHQEAEGRFQSTFQNGRSWAIIVIPGHCNQATT